MPTASSAQQRPTTSGQQQRPPPVRPLSERVRDTAIVTGAVGGMFGACVAAYKHSHIGPVLGGTAMAGATSAALGSAFIGLRHALIQGDFRKDSEVVTGLSMGLIALTTRLVSAGPRPAAFSGGAFFAGGCALHHAHRYWLHYRLTHDV